MIFLPGLEGKTKTAFIAKAVFYKLFCDFFIVVIFIINDDFISRIWK